MRYGKEIEEMNQGELIQYATKIEDKLMFIFEEELSSAEIVEAFNLMRDLYKCGFRCGLLCNEPYQPKES